MDPRCARHPDILARGTCARCGDYVCEGCRHPKQPDHCSRCGDRLPQGIAWEDLRYGRLPWRYLLTLWQVFRKPAVAFPGPARPGPAIGFALINGLWVFVPMFALVLAQEHTLTRSVRSDWDALPVLVMAAGFLAVGFLLFMGATGLSFAIGLRVAGRTRGLLRFAARASGYASGVLGIIAMLHLLLSINFVLEGPRLLPPYSEMVLSAATPVLAGRVYFHAAKGLGLPSGRAVLAALGPTVLCSVPDVLSQLLLTSTTF